MSNQDRLKKIRKYAITTKWPIPFHQPDCERLGELPWRRDLPPVCYCGLDSPLEYVQDMLRSLDA